MRPCGQGLVDYTVILPLLYQHNPNLNLTIENASNAGQTWMEVFDPVWHASHKDLTTAELGEWFRPGAGRQVSRGTARRSLPGSCG
jgi:sugar phosphate isomerase/epimerase